MPSSRYEEARKAIEALFSDKSVTLETTRDELEELRDLIDSDIDSISSDLDAVEEEEEELDEEEIVEDGDVPTDEETDI